MTGVIEDVRALAEVPVPPRRAFEVFVDEFGSWWPAEYSWSGETLVRIAIEPRTGGMCVEVGPHGFRCDWGRVLAYEPPRRLVFSWQIGPTASRCRTPSGPARSRSGSPRPAAEPGSS